MLFFDIFLSVLGVFGVWCLFKFTAEAISERQDTVKAIYWDGREDIEELLPLCLVPMKPVVLLSGEIQNEKTLAKLQKLGIEIYRILEYNK